MEAVIDRRRWRVTASMRSYALAYRSVGGLPASHSLRRFGEPKDVIRILPNPERKVLVTHAAVWDFVLLWVM